MSITPKETRAAPCRRHGGILNEPARDLDARAAAQDELDAILREAEASRRSGGPDSEFDEDGPVLPAPIASLDAEDDADATDTAKPREGVRFDRFAIKVPEAGENNIPTYQINSALPIIGALGVVALLLWIMVPNGIQFLRPQVIPEPYVDASARWILTLTRQRISRFEEQQGRLPQSLEELDANLSDVVTYQGLPGGGYVLQSPGHKGMLVLRSDMSQERFIAQSADQLRHVPGTSP